jgi:signal transduction histidine kinase/putative methionine-R-sulfoxide reductase with GAF domain
MRRRSRAGGELVKSRSRKTVTLKRRNAPKAVGRRSSFAAGLHKKVALLTRGLEEAHQQQAATADVLKIISRSTFDLQAVLETLVESAARLCEADQAMIRRREGGVLVHGVGYGYSSEFSEYARTLPIEPGRGTAAGRALLECKIIHIPDVRADPEYTWTKAQRFGGFRTVLAVPMLRESNSIGVLTLTRSEVRPFTDKQIELVTAFADQAVIAMENARLLNELRESLEQQTATSEVLRVISSSPTSLQPVFDSIAESAVRLCSGQFGFVVRFENKVMNFASCFGLSAEGLEVFRNIFPRAAGDDTAAGRAISRRAIVEIPDVEVDAAYGVQGQHLARTVSYRSIVGVPLLHEGNPIGAIAVARANAGRFPERQIALLQAFADQAVIAIRNVRLFDEVQARTNDLTESLEQQTATSEVLKVISSSPGELQPVFHAMLENATRICEASFGNLLLREGDTFRRVATHNAPPNFAAFIAKEPLIHRRQSRSLNRLIETKQADHIADMAMDEPETPIVKFGGARTLVTVPMLKENELIGAIGIYRQEVRPFNDKQVELVTNFASQAVIAIENTRLLNELRQSLQQQTATADVLKVISRSTFDLQSVLNTLTQSATRLCEADKGAIMQREGDVLRIASNYGFSREAVQYALEHPLRPDRGSATGRAAVEGKPIHIPDVLADQDYQAIGYLQAFGYRTILAVPLLREGTTIGTFTLTCDEVNPFTEKQIELVTTFADQAVIAIENARLLSELRTRTDELGRSVSELRALGEVSQAVNSTIDLETVLSTIVAKAVQLSGTEAGAIYGYDEQAREFRLRATYGMDQGLIDALTQRHIGLDDPNVAPVFARREPVQVADLREEAASDLNEITLRAGFRARMVAPLLRGENIVGMLVVRRRTPGEFAKNTVDLITTFAAQSALAIQNARLFHEIEDKSRQLEEASQHKSQFLANMSHELRTPLNAILGYTELMADGAYGEPSERMMGILKRLETNGRHLLGLINDVLDLSKIEAGQLVLELSDYSVQDIAQTVRSTLEPLASDKKLGFKVEVAPQLPSGRGDGRRLTQVLINLVGNAIKFTDAGEVAIKAEANNGSFYVAVRDTGPGISAADQTRLFQEFQQADNAITKKKGGTGLGLAISKRIIEMHGGRIWVESQPGQGSTFTFTLPVIVERQIEAA